jgi:hypothetical protein
MSPAVPRKGMIEKDKEEGTNLEEPSGRQGDSSPPYRKSSRRKLRRSVMAADPGAVQAAFREHSWWLNELRRSSRRSPGCDPIFRTHS